MFERSPSDGMLLDRLREGEEGAPTTLYLRYAGRLRDLAAAQSSPDLARRIDPDDIVQSVFRTFFRRAVEGHYAIPDGEEIWKLLLVIALNKVRAAGAFHRAAKRDVRQTLGGDAYEHAISTRPAPDAEPLAVLRLVVDDLLDAMPAPQRRMIELRIEGHEVQEIADEVQRSKRSVERVLQDFRRRLDELICDDP